MTSLNSWLHSLPCGFMRFHYTSVLCLWNLVVYTKSCFSFRKARMTWIFLFARHGSFHLDFQLFPAFVDGFWIFFVFQIYLINSSQFARILKLWLFICPFLPFSSLRCFTEIGPYFWPHVIQSRSRLVFWKSPPGPNMSLRCVFLQ